MSHFSLPADCTVSQAAALKAALQPLIASEAATVVVSAADVERCDASLLQVLAALASSLSRRHRSLDVREPSAVLLDCAAVLGMSAIVSPGGAS